MLRDRVMPYCGGGDCPRKTSCARFMVPHTLNRKGPEYKSPPYDHSSGKCSRYYGISNVYYFKEERVNHGNKREDNEDYEESKSIPH